MKGKRRSWKARGRVEREIRRKDECMREKKGGREEGR